MNHQMQLVLGIIGHVKCFTEAVVMINAAILHAQAYNSIAILYLPVSPRATIYSLMLVHCNAVLLCCFATYCLPDAAKYINTFAYFLVEHGFLLTFSKRK